MSDEAALVVRLEARINAFEQSMNKAVRQSHGAASRIEKAFAASNDNINRRARGSSGFGKVISGSLKEVENQARSLGSRAGPVSGVIEGLGPAGLAAGVGLGALVVALGQARAAMDMADELSDSAAKLNVNVERLQEYRFAVRAAGGELTDADKALAAFNITLGQAQAGYKKPLKVFELLGFTKADLDQVRSGEELLPRIADKIRTLGSTAERAAIIDKLGLTGLKPLLEQGADGMQKLIQAQRDLGVVLSQETIGKAAEAHDKIEALSTVIDTQLKVAFIGLSGPIVEATQNLANFLSWIAKVANDPTTKRLVDAAAKISGAGIKGLAQNGPVGMSIGGAKAAFGVAKQRIANRNGSQDILDMLAGGPVALPADFADVYGKKSGPVLPPNLVTLPPGAGSRSAESRARADGRYAGGMRSIPGVKTGDAAEFMETPDLYVPHGGLEEFIRNGGGNWEAAGPALEKASRALEDLTHRTYDGIYDSVSGALDAGFRGGLKGVLRFFLEQFQRGLIASIAHSVASAGAGGKGGKVSSALATFGQFAGFFDGGGNIGPGQFGIAGERGPELIRGPANVLSRAGTMKALRGVAAEPSNARGAPVVHAPITIHADRSILSTELLDAIEVGKRQAMAASLTVVAGQAKTQARAARNRISGGG
ncbi:hypothetical protein [Caulobacter sp.]|uniref:hypothetical protein n=1 Tax=Caulobacter sp. TaxID=78 RepID=UPI003BAEA602